MRHELACLLRRWAVRLDAKWLREERRREGGPHWVERNEALHIPSVRESGEMFDAPW